MSYRLAWGLLVLLLLLLLVGTQMPGVWRASLEVTLHGSWGLSSWSHFVLFAGMTTVLRLPPLGWPLMRVTLATLGLALLTEALQFFAIDRHPRWTDVGIDMAGALAGILLAMAWARLGKTKSPAK